MVNMAKDLCAKGYKEGSVDEVGHGAGGSDRGSRSRRRAQRKRRSNSARGLPLHRVGLGGHAREPAYQRVVRVGRRRRATIVRGHFFLLNKTGDR